MTNVTHHPAQALLLDRDRDIQPNSTQFNDDWNNKLPLNGTVLGEVNPGKPDLRYIYTF
jgi:hypothetical protein